MDRRTFIRSATVAAASTSLGARGASGILVDLRVGVVLPAGDSALTGVRLGAQEAAHAARLFRAAFTLHEAFPGSAAVEQLFADHAVHVIVGGAPAGEADRLMDLTARAGVLYLNVGSPVERLANACAPNAFHLLPAEAMRAAARVAAGAAADAAVVGWHPALERFGAAQVTDRYRAMSGTEMDERAWAGWMAMKVAFDASQRAGTVDARELAAFLTSARAVFDGHKGMQLSFSPRTRQLRQPLYVLNGDRVAAEVPSTRELGTRTHAELLDDTLSDGGAACGF